MKKVGIADLKARLSEHLRAVRAGRTLIVMDRQTPVARIVPYEYSGDRLVIRHPPPGSPRPCDVPLPKPIKVSVDPVAILLEYR